MFLQQQFNQPWSWRSARLPWMRLRLLVVKDGHRDEWPVLFTRLELRSPLDAKPDPGDPIASLLPRHNRSSSKPARAGRPHSEEREYVRTEAESGAMIVQANAAWTATVGKALEPRRLYAKQEEARENFYPMPRQQSIVQTPLREFIGGKWVRPVKGGILTTLSQSQASLSARSRATRPKDATPLQAKRFAMVMAQHQYSRRPAHQTSASAPAARSSNTS